MSETTTTTRPRRAVGPHDRDWGVPKREQPDPQFVADQMTRREREIMATLLAAIQPDGTVTMTSRAELRTSSAKMQEWYYSGWVNGAGSPDERGSGNTPASSWWWLTTHGEAIARAIPAGGAA